MKVLVGTLNKKTLITVDGSKEELGNPEYPDFSGSEDPKELAVFLFRLDPVYDCFGGKDYEVHFATHALTRVTPEVRAKLLSNNVHPKSYAELSSWLHSNYDEQFVHTYTVELEKRCNDVIVDDIVNAAVDVFVAECVVAYQCVGTVIDCTVNAVVDAVVDAFIDVFNSTNSVLVVDVNQNYPADFRC